jgi:hypothetical protein
MSEAFLCPPYNLNQTTIQDYNHLSFLLHQGEASRSISACHRQRHHHPSLHNNHRCHWMDFRSERQSVMVRRIGDGTVYNHGIPLVHFYWVNLIQVGFYIKHFHSLNRKFLDHVSSIIPKLLFHVTLLIGANSHWFSTLKNIVDCCIANRRPIQHPADRESGLGTLS